MLPVIDLADGHLGSLTLFHHGYLAVKPHGYGHLGFQLTADTAEELIAAIRGVFPTKEDQ